MPAIDLSQFTYSAAGIVRTRAAATDPMSGLRGHAYIAARNLAAPVKRIQHSAQDQLAAVLNIQVAQRERRRQLLLAHPRPDWNLMTEESLEHLHQALDLAGTEA